jgi:hypothetical protein
MDQTTFVEIIREVVIEGAISSVEELITNPPGRPPQKEVLNLSNWFKALSVDDKKMVRNIIEHSANSAVFGFLCVLDGVRAIEDSEDKGKLLLYFEKKEVRVLLNDFDKEFLHDIYNAVEN